MSLFSSYFAPKNYIGSVSTDAVSLAFKYNHPLGFYKFGKHSSSIKDKNVFPSMPPIKGNLTISVDNINSENAQRCKKWLALKEKDVNRIILMRKGAVYEVLNIDAMMLHKKFGIPMNNNSAVFPAKNLESYSQALINDGYNCIVLL